jgi:hypothetical protein
MREEPLLITVIGKKIPSMSPSPGCFSLSLLLAKSIPRRTEGTAKAAEPADELRPKVYESLTKSVLR